MAKAIKTAQQKSDELAEQITNKFIEAIENGLTGDGWVRPWTLSGTFPTNPTTGKDYNGMNVLMLMMVFGGGYFAGYGQWKKDKNAQVRKGERGFIIQRPQFRKTGKTLPSGKDEMFISGFVSAKIFHSSQVDGWEPPIVNVNEDFKTHARVESQIDYMISKGVILEHGGDIAGHSPKLSKIVMPNKQQFKDEDEYYSTILHELVHWTGTMARLNRKKAIGESYGRNAYAFEELVAELGASMLCAELGVHNGYQENHAKYISGWLTIMKGDINAIMQAGKLASTAVDVIMGRRTLTGGKIDEEVVTDLAA